VLHRRIAEALERGPEEAPVEAVAYHYARSGMPDKAVLYLERAGDHAAAQAAHAAAEEYYRDVVARLDALGHRRDSARAREKLGVVLHTAPRYDAALEVLDQAAEAYGAAGDLESLGRTTAQMGQVHASRGTVEEGLERLQPVLERLEASGVASLAALYVALARLFFSGGRYTEQLAAAERAVALARAGEDDKMRAEALWPTASRSSMWGALRRGCG
jgi:tetratricopeptide (TPR) repeat protein